jgi:hypothetical protein
MQQLREAAQVSAAIEEAGKARAAKNVGIIKTAVERISYITLPLIVAIGLSLLWQTDAMRKKLGEKTGRNNQSAIERIENVEQTLVKILAILENSDLRE